MPSSFLCFVVVIASILLQSGAETFQPCCLLACAKKSTEAGCNLSQQSRKLVHSPDFVARMTVKASEISTLEVELEQMLLDAANSTVANLTDAEMEDIVQSMKESWENELAVVKSNYEASLAEAKKLCVKEASETSTGSSTTGTSALPTPPSPQTDTEGYGYALGLKGLTTSD